jgi:predicted lipid-binding transport protein (Tim44 family)
MVRNPEDSTTPNSRAVPVNATASLMKGLTGFLVGFLTPQCGQDLAAVLAIFPHFLHRANVIGFTSFFC